MIYVFDKKICDCGSEKIVQGSQEYSTEGKWTTLKKRRNNPNIRSASIIPALCILDYTWYCCADCKKELDPEFAKQEIELMTRNLFENPPKEKIGMGVVNVGSIKKLKLKLDNER